MNFSAETRTCPASTMTIDKIPCQALFRPLYLAADHLGSTRLVLDANGTCLNRSDFLPFGHELWRTDPCYLGNPAGAGPVTQRFTGQERDAEPKLDFFGARYYSAGQGRFTSPDAPFADQSPADPLSWNLYSYVRNNPMRSVSKEWTAPLK